MKQKSYAAVDDNAEYIDKSKFTSAKNAILNSTYV